MERRSNNIGGRDDHSGSTRNWFVSGAIWEIETALTAIPVVAVAGLLTLLFDMSFTVVIVIGVGALLAVRLVVGVRRRLTAPESGRRRPPHEDV